MVKRTGNLYQFFAITIVWSWTFWLPEILWEIRTFMAPWGPFVAAFYMVFKTGGAQGIIDWLKKGFNLNTHPVWYVIALF